MRRIRARIRRNRYRRRLCASVPFSDKPARGQHFPPMGIGNIERQAAVGERFRCRIHPPTRGWSWPDQGIPTGMQVGGQFHRQGSLDGGGVCLSLPTPGRLWQRENVLQLALRERKLHDAAGPGNSREDNPVVKPRRNVDAAIGNALVQRRYANQPLPSVIGPRCERRFRRARNAGRVILVRLVLPAGHVVAVDCGACCTAGNRAQQCAQWPRIALGDDTAQHAASERADD